MSGAVALVLGSALVRIYALRSILFTSLISISFTFCLGNLYLPLNAEDSNHVLENMPIRYINLVFCIFCVVHHVCSTFRTRLLPMALDSLLLLAEIGTCCYLTAFISWSGPSFVTLVQLVALITASVARVSAVRKDRHLLSSFYLLKGSNESYTYPSLSIIFGRMFWRNYLRAEGTVVRWIRTILAGLVIGLLVAYAIYSILIQPSEAPPILDHLHVTTFYSRKPLHVADDFDRLIVYTEASAQIADVLTFNNDCDVPCVVSGTTGGQLSAILQPNATFTDAVYTCPRILECHTTITLNISNGASVYVLLAHHDAKLEDIVRFTTPMTFQSNRQSIATFAVDFHRPLNNPVFYAFGFGSFGFGLPSIIHPIPNLLHMNSDLSNTTDLRLQLPGLPSPYYKVTQVVTEHSVLDGLAQLGGMWTIAEGFFVLMFGGSLVYFMFGSKPLSRFGLIHLLQQRRLKDVLHHDFPLYSTEGGRSGAEANDAGLVAFLREHFVNSIDDTGLPLHQPELHHSESSGSTVVEREDMK